MNRKLIRPNLAEIKERMNQDKERERERGEREQHEPREQREPREPRPDRGDRGDRGERGERDKDAQHKRMHPPTDTFAESYYYLKQMNKKTPMAVVYTDGQIVEGYVEWYDRNCIKLNREGAPNLLIYKSSIRCIYKVGESEAEGPSPKK